MYRHLSTTTDNRSRVSLLKYGLAIVLMFVGVKMMLLDVFKIPVLISLGIVATIIATSIILSLRKGARTLSRSGSGYLQHLT
jgi:tellurite resistance protein TerC